MPRGRNQKRKLTSLMEIMLHETDEEHAIDIDEIRDHLLARDICAERRSLYDDFRNLEYFGVEIQKERRGRYFFYKAISRNFELAEMKILVDAVQASKFITEKKSRELIAKIKSNASKYQAGQLQRQVYIHDRVKTMNESIYYSVDTIHEAINQNRQVQFYYCEWNRDRKLVPKHNKKVYEISPWAVSFDDGNYYLIGYDNNPKPGQDHIKHYRVDKMTKINLSNKYRDGKDEFEYFDVGQYAKMSFSMYAGKRETVKIEFPENKIGIFIDRFGKDSNMREIAPGRWVIRAEVLLSRHFYGWVFSLGDDVKITGPKEAVEEMTLFLRKQIELYSE